ncbi:MAG: family 43 glycosylhydrolase [Micromonosporaceae bacterium]|nr:family 43 glycosylhydrolase [Micromonosporaceae bacterium]
MGVDRYLVCTSSHTDGTRAMIRRTRLLLSAAVFATALGATVAATAVPATAAVGDSARKVTTSSFPDPGFARFTTQAQGTKYYLYSTGAGFRVARSQYPDRGFSIIGKSMTERPAWTVYSSDSRPAQLWAPHVFQTRFTPGAEQFTMYFAARRRSDYRHCIGAATSNSPTGLFKPASAPLVCPPSGYSEAIDPVEYMSRYGNRYLVYKIGNYSPRRFQIMAIRVGNDAGLKRTGAAPRVVLSQSQIGSAVAEAPDVYRDGNGRVHLFVSRNGYKDCNYATQVWSGPELFSMGNPRWVAGLGPTSDICGSGGAEVIKDGTTLRVAFHARQSYDPLVRPAWTGVLRWTSRGNPYLA